MCVPLRYRAVEPKAQIWISLRTDSETEAARAADDTRLDMVAQMEALLFLGSPPPDSIEACYTMAVSTARALGMTYIQTKDPFTGDPEELVRRLNRAAIEDPLAVGKGVADAALGVVARPSLMLSALPARVIEIAAHDNDRKCHRQDSNWTKNCKRSLGTLLKALGRDVEVLSIGEAEARIHQQYLKRRVKRREMIAGTASADLTYASSALKRYYESLALPEFPTPYAGVTIRDKNAEDVQKLEFSNEWIRDVLLKPGKFKALNSEARDAMPVILETGCRQGEVLDIPPNDIKLDDPKPHLVMRFVDSEEGQAGRELKNPASRRLVPLVGVALDAMRRHPEGFPRYRGKDAFSAVVNNFIKDNGLKQTAAHTIGGLRHSWESRLRDAGYDNEVRAEMMGHSMKAVRNREVYGDAAALEKRTKLARSVAFDMPDPFSEIGTRVIAKPRGPRVLRNK